MSSYVDYKLNIRRNPPDPEKKSELKKLKRKKPKWDPYFTIGGHTYQHRTDRYIPK